MIGLMPLFMLEALSRPSRTMTAGICIQELLHGLLSLAKDSPSRLASLPTLDGWHKMHFKRCGSLVSHPIFALLYAQRSGWVESDSDGMAISAEAMHG